MSSREPLPRSFGVNLVFDRDGDPATGMRWWGGGSTFRFDRLVTAWITRDGDRYSGTVGVTDDDGARGSHLVKLTTDVLVVMSDDARSVIEDRKKHFEFDSTACEMPSFSHGFPCSLTILG